MFEYPAGEIAHLSEEFETKTPKEILTWAVDAFWPQIVLSSSFQSQSVPLLHMASQIRHDILIFFLDTGYHFWDTLIFREQLASQWHLNVLDLYHDTRWEVFVRQHTRTLPMEDPNLCCFLNKVQPMQKALKDMKAWVSGIRRDQTAVRAHAKILELQPTGLLKINPMLNWTKADVRRYMEEYSLPSHPLFEKNYGSIGCAPCNAAIDSKDDERAGRWAGREKIECGLHTEMFQHKKVAAMQNDFRLDVSLMDK